MTRALSEYSMSLILAIETSCDETAAAVIEDGHIIRSNVVASQIEIHRAYGCGAATMTSTIRAITHPWLSARLRTPQQVPK